MNYLKDTIEYITKVVRVWVVVTPWEMAVRVRFGKHQKVLHRGVHFKIPVFDQIYKQTTRLRVLSLPMQTLSDVNGKTITIKAAIGYNISDIGKMYNTLYEPETTINNIALADVAKHISTIDIKDFNKQKLEVEVLDSLKKSDYGLDFSYVKVLDFAVVRTYRLIQDRHWHHEGIKMDEKV